VVAGAGRCALLVVAACSARPHPEDAAHTTRDLAPAVVLEPIAPPITAGAAGSPPPPTGSTGDLQIRVEWPGVPVAARSSPGRTACHTERAPSVSPTTTWGVPDALVIVEGAAPPPAAAHVSLADCTLVPRIAAGSSLAITSAADRPAKLVLRKRGAFDHLAASPPVSVMLPIAGHTATTALEPGNIYSLETDATEPEVAFIAALPDAYVTEASGHVLVHDLAVGSHAVTAWLPPRAGQPAHIGRGTATVTAGELAELTITLAP
jgi:hypothetical protein